MIKILNWILDVVCIAGMAICAVLLAAGVAAAVAIDIAGRIMKAITKD